jgi:hypothetical protein
LGISFPGLGQGVKPLLEPKDIARKRKAAKEAMHKGLDLRGEELLPGKEKTQPIHKPGENNPQGQAGCSPGPLGDRIALFTKV